MEHPGRKRKQEEEEETKAAYIKKHVEPAGKKSKQTPKEDEETTIQVGDVVNLSDLLFTNTRDYLIKHNHNQVQRKQLAGKVVTLLFVSLKDGYQYWETFWAHLLDVYHKLEPKGGFEVVFIAYEDGIPCNDDTEEGSTSTHSSIPDHDHFKECFSTMPWTAIPFWDLKSRKRLEKKFGIIRHNEYDLEPFVFVIDPRGVVVQFDADRLFSRYGAAGFPFTNQRIECTESEDNVARKQPSVTTLLASPERDYVITNKGEQVPVHELEDKVVGLFFFTDISSKSLAWELMMAYEKMSKNVKDFEVVLINLLPIPSNTCDDALWKTFEAAPWLAVPFNDTDSSKKLLRIFEAFLCDRWPDPVSHLVIIGPHGEYIEPFGVHIMMGYGIPAYPFTRFSAVNWKIKSVKDVKPDMLWNLDSVFRQQNGSHVRFSQIVGKRVIVLFENSQGSMSEHTLNKLKAFYIQMKGTEDDFEVIHIHEGCKFEAAIPWLTHPPFDTASEAGRVVDGIFENYCDGLVAFDRDGTIVRLTKFPRVGKMVFPFYEISDSMEDEVMQFVEIVIDRWADQS